jgi:hypothetical protein
MYPKVCATLAIFAPAKGPQSGVRLTDGVERVLHSVSFDGLLEGGGQSTITVAFSEDLEGR